MSILETMNYMVNALRIDNSTYHKQKILTGYMKFSIRTLLEIIYNPYKLFYLTGDGVDTYYYEVEGRGLPLPNTPTTKMGIIQLLNILTTDMSIRGNTAKDICCSYIEDNYKYYDLIISILNKDLKCGISIKTINKVSKGLIPEFNVPLAKEYKDGMCDFKNDDWYMSQKINGIRCLAFIYENDIKFFTRNGNEIYTLDNLKRELEVNWRGSKATVLDGELAILDENGVEQFTGITSEWSRKNHIIENPAFLIFDAYPMDHFKDEKSLNLNFNARYEFLKNNLLMENHRHIKIIEQVLVKSNKDFEMIPENWEGYVLKKNDGLQFKRGKNLLKVKNFMDKEFIVTGINRGQKVIEGLNQPCCGSLIIEYKGHRVSVGSGLSDQQRLYWFSYPSSIIGKKVTVQYFSESVDKNGELSLWFPTLKHIWDGAKV